MEEVIKGRYKILSSIGIGGMAEVYLALDIQSGRTVAVKIMDKKLLSDSHYVERFKREISITKHLNHPNIPEFIDYGELEDTKVPYLVMEYIQGIPLSKYIERKGKLSIKEATDIAIQVLSALSYAYKNGVRAHRDIKPSNIMIETGTNRVKVMDFGIAKTVGSQLTHSTVLYTPGYASPEQLLPSKFNNEIDKRTDIYSIGVVLYEMLTGKLPYAGTTPAEVVEEQLKNNPASPSDIRRDIPSSYSQIIIKCIQLNPDDRYQSPEEVIEDLKKGRCSKPATVTSQIYNGQTVSSNDTQIERTIRERYNANNPRTTGSPLSSKTVSSYHSTLRPKPMRIVVPLIVVIAALITGVTLYMHNVNSNRVALGSSALSVSSTPEGAEIYIDNKDTGEKTPTTIENVSVGKHTITLRKDGCKIFSGPITIQEGKEKVVNASLIAVSGNNNNKNAGNNNSSGSNNNNKGKPTPPIHASLSVTSNPAGAKVYFDGNYKGITPLTISLSKGSYNIKIIKDGYKAYAKNIDVESGGTVNVSAVLTALKGTLSITSTPSDAEVYVDNKNTYKTTPAIINDIPLGTHTVTLKKEGYKDYTKSITVNAEETVKIIATLEKKEAPSPQTGTLSISSNPAGAKVYIKGEYKGITPLLLTLKTGSYNVKVTKSNYRDYTKSITITEDKTTNLSATLLPMITCSWKEITKELAGIYVVRSIAINPNNTNIIYAGTGSGFRGNVLKSTDGGTSWKKIDNLKNNWVLSLVIHPDDTDIVYAVASNDIFKSTDGGKHWREINNVLTNKGVYALAIDPENTNVVYAGTWESGVFKSTDGGEHWSKASNGLTNRHVLSLAIDPKNTNVIYAGTYGDGVFKSTDGGEHWNKADNGLTNIAGSPNTHVNSLAIDPKNTNVIYAGTDQYDGGIFKSTDGGASWSKADNGLPYTNILSLAIDLKNTNIIYAGTWGDGVFKSTDGGESWKKLSEGMPEYTYVYTLAIDPKNTDIIYAGTGDGVYKYICTSP